MTREREIFQQALEQPIEGRSAFVERATGGDPRLKEAVEELLANNQGDTFLENGAAGLLRESLEAAGTLTPGEERIGDFIGGYKLLEKIGEGGFGVVYRAEQTEPVRRHVALKVIRVGMDTKSVVSVPKSFTTPSRRVCCGCGDSPDHHRWHGGQRVAGVTSDKGRTKRGRWPKA